MKIILGLIGGVISFIGGLFAIFLFGFIAKFLFNLFMAGWNLL